MKFYKAVVFFLITMPVSFFAAAEGEFVLGTDYEITAPQTQTGPIVEEFFNYACGACYGMERFSSDFKEKNPGVTFKYVPVELRPSWKIYVEAYYIGEKLNVLDKSHGKLFDRIHVNKKYFKDKDEMKTFFLELGVDEKEYDKVAKSYWLKTQLRQAKQYAFKHKVTGTPSYLVNKRIKLNRSNIGSLDRLESAILKFSKE